MSPEGRLHNSLTACSKCSATLSVKKLLLVLRCNFSCFSLWLLLLEKEIDETEDAGEWQRCLSGSALAWLGSDHDPSEGRRELSAHPVSYGHVGEVGSSGRWSLGPFQIPAGKMQQVRMAVTGHAEGGVCDSWQERAAGGWSRYQSKHPVTLSLCLPSCGNLKCRSFQALECQVKLKLSFLPAEVTSKVCITK